MRTLVLSCAALALVLGTSAARAADEEAKKVIDAAVKAHGGAEALAKQKDKAAISKGKMKIAMMDLDATLEMYVGDKKFKQIISLNIMGKDYVQNIIYNGKGMYITLDGKVIMSYEKKEELDALKEMMGAEEMAGLVLLGSKDVEASIIGDGMVEDTPVVGIRVSRKGHKDVSLYFDKKTHLLRKLENRGIDFATGQEVSQERILSDYKEQDGVKHPSRITVNQEGKKIVDLDLTEVKYVDKLDDDTFDLPK